MPEKLVIPFASVRGFFDPSVEFAVQFPLVDDQGGPAADGVTDLGVNLQVLQGDRAGRGEGAREALGAHARGPRGKPARRAGTEVVGPR